MSANSGVEELDSRLNELLGEIEQFATDYDAKNRVHEEQILTITPDTGSFLSIIIQATKSKNVLEIGTSSGYSTLWIADALKGLNGRVTTVEVSEKKAKIAKENFAKSDLGNYIDLHVTDIRPFLKTLSDESFDLIFLDAERPQYVSYWEDIDRVLKTGSLLIVDNAQSPKPEELTEFFKLVISSKRFLCQTIQLGKGEFLALKLSV